MVRRIQGLEVRTTRARSAVALTLLALAASGVAGASSAATDPEPPAAPASDRANPRAGAERPADVAREAPPGTGARRIDVSESGRVRKQVGEPAGLVTAGAERASFQITVEDITVRQTCPGRGVALAPERGYFVIIEIEASVAADASPGGRDLFMPVVADSFDVVGTDGTSLAGPSEASWGCYEDDELAAPFVGSGETTAGLVVLDSAVAQGRLVYAPGGSSGWEWSFG